ncbi:MAG: SfiI family type II restriction endonuclease [bacterium]|nr:SfiI family type II restriction endonuclease [bacterium]
MTLLEDISSISNEQIELVEKLTLRWIFQATLDFGMEAFEIFLKSPDDVKDVAEDITREFLDRLPGFNIPQRIFGTVDYKKARYVILPEWIIRQALFVDSKAEKENRSATIQMSQTSMHINQLRSQNYIYEKGRLPPISIYNNKQYLTTTTFVHFKYNDVETKHYLEEATLFCLPNGLLQTIYA